MAETVNQTVKRFRLEGNFDKAGFWGETTATVDWCETNYEVTFWVAEFWNTISNIFLVLFSIYGVRMCIREQHANDLLTLFILVGVIGVGSALFHGTLLKVSQQLDETPMIFAIVQWNYSLWKKVLPWNKTNFWVTLAVVHNIIFAVVHAYLQTVEEFQMYFAAWVLLGTVRLYSLYHNEFKENAVVRKMIKTYVNTYLFGSTWWLVDQHFCDAMHNLPFNPQGHAIWHVAVGIAGYLGPAALAFYIAKERGLEPSVGGSSSLLPYIHIKKRLE